LGAEQEHEVDRKPTGFGFNGAVQRTCLNTLELGQIGINQDFSMAHIMDQ
jgi:hypothetical protein